MSKKDWKKQLFRVKQIADQNLGRVEKSEVLSEDLQHLDKKVDLIKKVYHDTGKKLLSCYQGREGQDFEKRLRKLPEYGLSHTMKESATVLKEDTLMGSMFNLSGDAQMGLASELLQYEMEVERKVMAPMQNLLDNDIPTIQKSRKQLSKLTLDMDSARGRYESARRNTQMQGAKLESIKDELEEAQHKVEACRDQLTTEMYSFVAKEADYSSLLLELVSAQAEYHRKSLALCERCLPRMQEQMDFHSQMPVYGTSLEDHLRRTNRDIALVIEECICVLLDIGMEEEGLFRIAGAASKAKKLKAAFNSNQVDMQDYITDVHCIAGALKLYLRELPEPLMTYPLYNDWMQAAHMPANQRMEALWHVVNRLPKPNYNNLRYLIKFLHKLSENQSVNKMSAGNIAIVIGPNMIWPQGEGGPSVLTTSTQSAIVEALITHADWFFPGDCDFRKTGKGMAASPPPVGIRKDRFLFPTKDQDNGPVPSTSTFTTSSNTNSNQTLASIAATGTRDSPTVSVFRKDRPRKASEPESSLRAGLGMAHKTLTVPVSSPSKTTRKEINEKPIEKTSSSVVDSAVPLRSRVRGSSVGRFEMGRTAPYISAGDRSSIHGDTISLGGASYYPLTGIGAQSWRDKPVNFGKPTISYTGVNTSNNAFPTSRNLNNGSVETSYPSYKSEGENGASKASTCGDSDGISDCVSEPGGLTGWSVRHYNSGLMNDEIAQRAITPPPKALPPRAVHSDMYNTVFALQALNCDGWSDYLTRVRGLWDGHMSNNKSPTPSPNVPTAADASNGSTPKSTSIEVGYGDGGSVKSLANESVKGSTGDEIREGTGASSERSQSPEIDFNGGSSNTSSPAGTLKYSHTPGMVATQEVVPDLINVSVSPPANATAPLAAPVTSGSTGSLSTEGLDLNGGSTNASPRPPRRKKTAPPPPPERPNVPPPAQPATQSAPAVQSTPAAQTEAPKITIYPSLAGLETDPGPIQLQTEKSESFHHTPPKIPDRPQIVTDKPTIPERPSSPRAEKPPSPKPDRPRGPPPERPGVAPPDKPPPPADKPAMPGEKPAPVSEKPCKPEKPPVMEKPKSPISSEAPVKVDPTTAGSGDPPEPSHQRQPSTGSRPPRPTPPPPPPPRPSRESTGSTAEEASPPKPPERKESRSSDIEEFSR